MFNSLRFRFALIFISLAIGPLIIVGAIIGARSYNTLEQQSLVLQRKVAEGMAHEIGGAIEHWENELVLINELYGLGALELKEQRAILSSIIAHQHDFQEVALLDSEGQEQIRLSRTTVILDDDLQSRAGNEEFLFHTTNSGTYLGPVFFDDTIREPLVTISVPVFNRSSEELVSVLVAESRFKVIWDLLSDLELASEGEVYVINQAGLVVAHRHPDIVLRGTTIELPEVDGQAEGLSGTNVIVAKHTIQFGNQELVVVAEQPVSSALELATNSLFIMATVIVVALAFSSIIALFMTRRIVRPIEALATSAQAISNGNFSQRVEISSRDEVGQLASSFNKMAEDLARSTTSIDNLNKEITERRLAEARLQESEERYHSIIEDAHDMVQSVGLDGKLIFVNRAWLETLGFTEAELPKLNLFNIISTESLVHCQELFAKVMRGESVQNFQAIFIAKDGREITVEGSATPRYFQNNVVATQGIFRDITERKQAENKINQLYKQVKTLNTGLEQRIKERTGELEGAVTAAKNASQAKSEFLASMSHELRTPLNAVIGFSQVLGKQYFGKLNEKQAEYVSDIFNSGQHLLALINDVLDLSKVEAGKMELEISKVKINDLLQSSLTMIKERAQAHIISLETQTAEDIERLEIMADERRIKQVIFNLLSNAIKFTPDGGAIKVRSRREGEELIISVSDTGIGISPQEQKKVFEEFYQASGGVKDKTPGTGLGLALTKSIVEMHGGRVWVESEGKDKGSRFTFTLPIRGVNS